MDVLEENKIEKIEKDGRKKNGGKRQGSGRKSVVKTEKVYTAREKFYLWVDERWSELLKGIEANQNDKEMLKWVFDQRLGKAAIQSTVDVTTGGKPIPILYVPNDTTKVGSVERKQIQSGKNSLEQRKKGSSDSNHGDQEKTILSSIG